jgi:excisionase family DNA binding protein
MSTPIVSATDLMSASETARALGVTTDAVWQLCAVGRLRAVEVLGRPLKLDRESVKRFLAEQAAAAAAAGKRPSRRRARPAAAVAGK